MIYSRPNIRSDDVTFESKHFYILLDAVWVGYYYFPCASARYQCMV